MYWLKEHKTPFTKLECGQMAARFNTGVRQRRRDDIWPRMSWEIMIRQTDVVLDADYGNAVRRAREDVSLA